MGSAEETEVSSAALHELLAKIPLNSESDILHARSTGRVLAGKLGFGLAEQTRLATAISELTRNVIQHAGSGGCEIFDESSEDEATIRVVVEDHGPGIADVREAMEDGFSTKNSLGAGLPGTRRLVQDFDIQSQPGHTVVTIVVTRKLFQ